jgi:hypothetical protein
MYLADRNGGCHYGVEDSDENGEKECDVADLRSLTDSSDSMTVAAGGAPSIPSAHCQPGPETCPFHVKHSSRVTRR